jgi:hypothetical protein
MSTLTLELTLELPAELVLALDVAAAPSVVQAAWLPAAIEALQAFRQLD